MNYITSSQTNFVSEEFCSFLIFLFFLVAVVVESGSKILGLCLIVAGSDNNFESGEVVSEQ